MRQNIYYLLLFLIFLMANACKSDGDTLDKIYASFDKNNKYADTYKDGIYYNSDIGLKVEFDGEWNIDVKYEKFREFSRQYADSFNSDKSEVIFVGENRTKKIGVRCIVEELDISPEEYIIDLKNQTQSDISTYDIVFEKQESSTWKNISGIHTVMETTINKWNMFVFDSLIFKSDDYIIKLDFWLDKGKYDSDKPFVHEIYDRIDFTL